MKKLFALLISVMLCFCFVACTTTPVNKSEVSSVITESETSSFSSSDSATTSSEPTSSKSNSTSTSSKNNSTSSKVSVSSGDTNSKASTSSHIASVSIPSNLRPVISSKPSTDKVSSTVLGGTQEDSQNSTITPLLYSVKGQNGATIYLFGSIHVGSMKMYPFPSYLISAIMGSDSVAVEYNLLQVEDSAATSALLKVMYKDGRTIKNDLTDQVYSSAKSILQRHKLYDPNFDYYQPVVWSNLIDSIVTASASYSAEIGIDVAVIDMALYDKKEIIEIESIESQYEVMSSLSVPLQDYLLRNSINNYKSYNPFKETEDLIDVWCKGDYESLRKLSGVNADGQSPTTKALLEEYHTKMQTNRDKKMTDFVVESLKGDKDIFVCVGTAHVVGENGIIDQLKDLGYTVTQITK